MPFGLTNAPASFQHFINDTLREYLDLFCTAYIDNILIDSDSLEEHRLQVRTVLRALGTAGLSLKPEKCEFHVQKTKFLGLSVSSKVTSMDTANVVTITEWPFPESVIAVQTFLGFVNFYRRFIQGYSEVFSPLKALTKKGVQFQWSSAAEAAFHSKKYSPMECNYQIYN